MSTGKEGEVNYPPLINLEVPPTPKCKARFPILKEDDEYNEASIKSEFRVERAKTRATGDRINMKSKKRLYSSPVV